MSDEKEPPGLIVASPVPEASANDAPPAATEAQKRAYRNRSSGASWFDAPPEKVPVGRKGERRGGRGAFDVNYPTMPMMMPPAPIPPQQQQRFSVQRQGTTPLVEIPIGTRCTGVVAALRESFGFIR